MCSVTLLVSTVCRRKLQMLILDVSKDLAHASTTEGLQAHTCWAFVVNHRLDVRFLKFNLLVLGRFH